MKMIAEYHATRFNMPAGTADRRALIFDLQWWLDTHIGVGTFLVGHGNDTHVEDLDWYITTYDDHFKVLLKNENDVTMFMLKWS